MDSDFITIIPALIGAVGGSFGGIILGNLLQRRDEREKLRKDIRYRHLIQVQYAVQSLWSRFHNMANQGGSLFGFKKEVKKDPEDGKINEIEENDDDYYLISTLYALGAVLAYHRILMFEGVYSQIEDMYPTFGTSLIRKFENLGRDLNAITMETTNSSGIISFFRYEQMALGDAVTENEEGHLKICSYLNFKTKYRTDSETKSALEPARLFVENLANAPGDLDSLKMILKQILDQLKSKTLLT